ncbi:MAG: GNAT family N-acetyltransferase, partial [Xanthomonadales bacterium]|nr:GNAT family N-acetyltransferase [Xanthomonadales bacterium]
MSEGNEAPARLIPEHHRSRMGVVHLRPVVDADLPLLARIYASTRESEMAQVPWSEAQKLAFLQFQFDAQHRYYLEHFPAATREVIELDAVPAGRLYLDARPNELRLIDIALLPEFRGGGIGELLLREILDAGRRSQRAVSIHVEQNNPAMRLYLRLGFVQVEEQGIYHLMRWQPEP